MSDRGSMVAQVETQLSQETKAHLRRLFEQRRVRPAGALFMAEQAGENVSGLTRIHVAAWLSTR